MKQKLSQQFVRKVHRGATENPVEFSRDVTSNPQADLEPDNQVESTRNVTLVSEAQAPPVRLGRSLVPSPRRPSKDLFLQGRPEKSIDVQQTSQVVKSRTQANLYQANLT